ncbi:MULTISPECIES: Calx-beta domain-containing protein [unclassified Thiocapsa]|uniref:Calx-beta domain-containing protein n=1 Tax=unclassified Thiocapsa TaxID=2641286 RepID=UPI0035B195FB
MSADDVAVNEADGTAEFVVTLSSPSAAPVTVSYATADGTATAGEDYESTSGVLTFAPGETVQVVEVAVLDDTAPEATESFDLVLSEASGATIARGRAVGTILDDDTPLSCGQPSYAAGSEAGVFLWQDCANARWHARVTAGGSGAAITYRGEIVASEPFTQAQGVLLELPWDVVDVTDPTRLGFTLGVAGTGQDGLAFAFPADADVCFGLDAPAGAQVYVGVGKTAVATPFDLTTLGACVPPPVISISDTALSEGDGPASVVVTLSVPRSVPVTVSYATVDGTATAGEDYESTSGVLTFVPGETVQVVEVAVIDDNAPEPTETFGVLLSNAVGAALGQATATVSILDDDVPLPELSVGDVTASEGDGVLGFVVSLSAASAVPVTVGYATVDGTALAGSDYLPVGESEGLTFQPGETTKTVNVELIDDDIPEPTKTLYLELIAPDVVVLTRAQGTATILDDDGALLELSVSDVTVGEDAGVAGFAVSLSGASAAPVTVSYATADGTATAGEDYESTSGVLTFAPGETVQVVEVAVFDDTAPEATESFDLVLSEASGATIARGRAVGTILDDDTPLSCGQPSYAAGSEAGVFLWQDCANARWHAWVTAGGSGAAITYRGEIVASEPFTQAQGVLLELPWDVVDVTDPTRIGFTLGVRGTGQDGLAFAFPADADVCFGLDAPAGAQVYVGVGKTAVATPFDLTTLGACVPPPVISISDTALSEADGPASVVVTLSVPRSVPVTVSYATVDGTATAGEDYESTSGVLTFVPGETVQVVEVAVIDDNAPEPTETFGVLLSNAVGAALGQATATVSILDDDGALLELSVSDVTVGEDAGVAGFAVSLSGASAAPVTVSYATADGTATAGEDYESTSGVLTFAPGETVQVVEVAVFDDTAPDATESFDLVLSEASGATIARGRAVGTILDDDTPLSCGQPSYAAGSEAGVFLWQDCANARWHAWVTAGGSGAVITYTGEIVASEPFTQAQGELLELPWDVVDVTDPTRIGFTLGVRGTGQDGLAFAFPADADVCFGLDAPAGAQVYVGVGKTAVATPFDLNTLGSCVALP